MNREHPRNFRKRTRSESSVESAEPTNIFQSVTSKVTSQIKKFQQWLKSPRSTERNGSVIAADDNDEDEDIVSPPIPEKRQRLTLPSTSFTSTEPKEHISIQVSPNIDSRMKKETKKSLTDVSKESSCTTSSTSARPFKKFRVDSSNGPIMRETATQTIPTPSTNADPFKSRDVGSSFYAGRTMYGGASSSSMHLPNIRQRKPTILRTSNYCSSNISAAAERVSRLLEETLPNHSMISQRQTLLNNSCLRLSDVTSPTRTNSFKTRELHVPSIATILNLKQGSQLRTTTAYARQLMASLSSTNPQPYPVATSKDNSNREEKIKDKQITKVKSRVTKTKTQDISEPAPIVNLPNATLSIDVNKLPKFDFGTTPKPQSLQSVTTMSSKSLQNTTTGSFQFTNPQKIITEPIKTSPCKETVNLPFVKPSYNTEPKGKKTSIDKDEINSPVQANKDQNKNNLANIINNVPITVTNTESKWKCEDCWVSNNNDANICICCGSKKPTSKNEIPVTNSVTFKVPINQPSTTNEWKCGDCWVKNKDDATKCLCCGAAKPGANATNANKPDLMLDNVKPAVDYSSNVSSEWKCNECWIKNKENEQKCVACGSSKPSAMTSISTPLTSGADWKCADCWVKNKDSTTVCIACGTSKPEDKSTNSNLSNSLPKESSKLFKNIVKAQSNKWECACCLNRNDSSLSKCACCESEKPGAPKQEKQFNFGVNTTFKFGIDPKARSNPIASVDDTSKSLTILDNASKSETNNNSLFKDKDIKTFSFGIPPKKTEDSVNSNKSKSLQFGLSNTDQNKISLSESPMFGIQKAPTIEKKGDTDDSFQKVPSVDLITTPSKKAESNSQLKQTLFGIPATPASVSLNFTSQPNTNVSVLTSTALITPDSKESSVMVSTSSDSLVLTNTIEVRSFGKCTPVNTPDKSELLTTIPKSLFGLEQFSKGVETSTASASPMFQPSETTSGSTASLFQPTVSTTVAATSLFQPPMTTTTLPVSLFQPLATTTVATTASSLFSFGTVKPAQTTAESTKASFTFTFGANKETPKLFTPTFGTTTASNTPTTTPSLFSMGGNAPTNGLGSSSTLVSLQNNPLTPGSGISVGTTFEKPTSNDNMWAQGNTGSINIFSPQTTSNTAPKPLFTFGTATSTAPAPSMFGNTSTPTFGISGNNETSTFGGGSSVTPAFGGGGAAFGSSGTTGAFGSGAATGSQPVFGSGVAPSGNVFGAGAQGAASPPALFGAPAGGGGMVFGSQPAASSPGLFGATQTPRPAFQPTMFDLANASATPNATPSFNFSQQQASPQPGLYNFGVASGQPQVQFNMGSAPGARRMRKAVRRTPR